MGASFGKGNHGFCADCRDMNISKIGTLRFVGLICIVFSAIEAALGGFVYRYVLNSILINGRGSWWSAIFVFVAGFLACTANNRGTVIAVSCFAAVGASIAALGTVTEAIQTYVFISYTGCGAIGMNGMNGTSTVNYFGNSDDFNSTVSCIASQPGNVSDSCHCVTSGGDYCGIYDLGFASTDCGGILEIYPNLLIASTVFCGLLFFNGIILAGLSCTILCKDSESYAPEAIGHRKWLKDVETDNSADDFFRLSSINHVEEVQPQIQSISDLRAKERESSMVNIVGDFDIEEAQPEIAQPKIVDLEEAQPEIPDISDEIPEEAQPEVSEKDEVAEALAEIRRR